MTPTDSFRPRPARAGRVLWGGVLYGMVAVALLAWYGMGQHLPAVLPSSASPEAFSAERAESLVRAWAPRPEAHPIGSPQADHLREGLVRSLRELGGIVEVQEAWAPGPQGASRLARVRNVIAHFPARQRPSHEAPATRELLLAAHYDSVAAGPGEHDDLVGCAVWVEAVRAHLAATGEQRRLGIWVLFTEGEETGLFGARAFVREHPAIDAIGLVANLEARGASGPSRLFEMGLDNAPWVSAYQREASYPSASSLSVEVYRRMPNGSDLTVFLDHGLPGMNFAYIGDWSAYHSPHDRLDRGDLRSVQHHGENGMAVLRAFEALGGVPLHDSQVAIPGDRGHVDLLGRVLWTWSPLTQWLATGAVLLALLWVCARTFRGPRAIGAWFSGLLLHFLWIGLPVLVAAAWMWPLRGWAGTDRPFWSRSLPAAVLALGAWGVAAAALLPWSRRVPERWQVRAAFGVYALLAIASTALVPGIGFLWVPAAGGLALVVLALPESQQASAAAAVGAGSLLFWIPLHQGLLDAFGWDSAVALLLPQTIPLALCVPAMSRSGARWGWAAGVAGGLCLVFAGVVTATREPFTSARPATLNVRFTEELDDRRQAEISHGLFRDVPEPDWEGLQTAVLERPLRPTEVPLASVHATADPAWWRVRLHSPRGATQWLWKGAAGGEQRVRLGSLEMASHGRTWQIFGAPPEGVEFEYYAPGGQPHEWACYDEVSGLPAALESWVAARGTAWVPRGSGHRWRVRARVQVFERALDPQDR